MTTEANVESSVIEAIFLRGLDTPPPLRAELKALGIDLERLELRYPAQTFAAALRLARLQCFASDPEPEAYRKMGRAFLSGFLSTLIGRVAGAVMHLLSARQLLERAPRQMKLGGTGSQLKVEHATDTSITFLYEEPTIPGEFMAGCLEMVLVTKGVTPRSQVTTLAAGKYRLELSWS
jgi:uncharacterized protein (TIGR02265 family)